jgi:hypothetical protein
MVNVSSQSIGAGGVPENVRHYVQCEKKIPNPMTGLTAVGELT